MDNEMLYKFRSFNERYHIALLKNKELYFASPRTFNDPFDCNITIRFDLCDEKYHKSIIRKHLLYDNPLLSEDQLEKEINYWYKREEWKKSENIKQVYEERLNSFGIFSMTSTKENILLWSHYSDSHRGFCVGFDYIKLKHFLKNEHFEQSEELIEILQVGYSNTYPILDPRHLNNREFVYKPLITKSNNWAYEKEYRLILVDKPNHKVYYPSEIISEIILGCKVSDSNRFKIIDVVKKEFQEAKVIQAKMKEYEFGLDFDQIYP